MFYWELASQLNNCWNLFLSYYVVDSKTSGDPKYMEAFGKKLAPFIFHLPKR